jgi:hypothetical protein
VKSLQKFFTDFGRVAKNRMNLSTYNDGFRCACGETHWFDDSIRVFCQGYWKIVIFCPSDPTYLTSIKIKTLLGVKFRGFETLDVTQIKTEEDRLTLLVLRDALK